MLPSLFPAEPGTLDSRSLQLAWDRGSSEALPVPGSAWDSGGSAARKQCP